MYVWAIKSTRAYYGIRLLYHTVALRWSILSGVSTIHGSLLHQSMVHLHGITELLVQLYHAVLSPVTMNIITIIIIHKTCTITIGLQCTITTSNSMLEVL